MAYRSIHDDVAISESLSNLSDFAERLYWRMLSRTDTFGRLPGKATKIKALCMPLVAAASAERVHDALRELREAGRVELYWVDDKPYLQFADFDEHQPSEFKRKRGKAKYPPQPGGSPIERLAAARIDAPAADVSALSPATSALKESKEEESTKANPAPAAPPRERDLVWDWLEDRFGRVAARTNAHSKRNKACADLKRLGATPDLLDAALQAWPKLFEHATPTDIAIATHYPQLTAGVNGTDARKSALSWFDNVGQHLPVEAFEEELAREVRNGLDEQTAADLRARHQETASV